METPDVLVIGGGLVGCTLAHELARANLSVTVVERGRVGCGASGAAAGLLSPTLGTAPSGALASLCHQSAALYQSWLDELRAAGAGDVGFRRPGMFEVWRTEEEAAAHRLPVDPLMPERPVERLDAAELRRREPALTENLFGAIFYPDVAQVDPARLIRVVARLAALGGVTIREAEPVQRCVRKGDHVHEVHTVNGSYRPKQVVLTAGAWSAGIADTLELRLPVRPVKGQLLLTESTVSPLQKPLCCGSALFIPRSDGGLLLGVTVEEAGFDERVTLAGLQTILGDAFALVPAIGPLAMGRAWAGLRPGTPDAWPFMGPLPPFNNLWVSTGHFRKGILLAPLCARLMARSILAGQLVEELEPFKPTRRLGS